MDVIELKADEKMLKLTITDDEWCQIYLVEDKEEIQLGADGFSYILPKFVIAFMPSQKKYFQYGGIEMFTIMNLMGPLAVIAGRKKSETELELIFIDTNGNIRPMMTITTEIEVDWITQLCKHLTKRYL